MYIDIYCKPIMCVGWYIRIYAFLFVCIVDNGYTVETIQVSNVLVVFAQYTLLYGLCYSYVNMFCREELIIKNVGIFYLLFCRNNN